MDDWYLQSAHGVRFEWGPTGAARLAAGAACVVVVDVLSFTTSVTVAVEAGTRVFPYRWRDGTAATFAKDVGADLAVGRRMATASSPWSLSPAALRRAPYTPRLVLPSPNGSSIAASAGELPVIAGALRNATAVSQWLVREGYGTTERPIAVIASGERWPDGSLRPAVEDLLGAGAIIAALQKQLGTAHVHVHARADSPVPVLSLSPEASLAAAAFRTTPDVAAAVTAGVSGRELIDGGFADDVAVATERDVCTAVPVLVDGAFSDRG